MMGRCTVRVTELPWIGPIQSVMFEFGKFTNLHYGGPAITNDSPNCYPPFLTAPGMTRDKESSPFCPKCERFAKNTRKLEGKRYKFADH